MPESFDKLLDELHALRVTLEGLRFTLNSLSAVTADHETRVRLIESRQQHLTPVVAGLTFLLGVLATEIASRAF